MSFLNPENARLLIRVIIEAIFPPRETELVVRKVTRDVVARLITPHVVLIPRSNSGRADALSITTLLPYRTEIVQSLILEAKFEKNVRAQALLGVMLTDYIKVSLQNETFAINGPPASLEITLVPLPLGEKRRKERGYNQVEEIARFVAHTLQISEKSFRVRIDSEILRRVRDTKPQTSLGRSERLENMRDAFGIAPKAGPLNPSTTYLLLDDVVTTGATLSAAYNTLIKGGATRIIPLALAH